MPDMDGFELLGLLRSSNIERARRIPVIALTAGVEPEAEYLSGGFAGYVRKPFRMEELMAVVSPECRQGQAESMAAGLLPDPLGRG